VIEGPDGAGKSTLAHWLMKQYGLDYHHEGAPPKNIVCLVHYGRLLHEAREHDRHVVYDRFALGERVYGPIYRKVDGLGADGWRVMKRLLHAAGVIQILCLPKYETCLNNWRVRRDLGNEMIEKEAVFKETYESWSNNFLGEHDYVYDYEHTNALKKVTELVKAGKIMLPSPLIGSPTAKYLLIGDQGSNPDSPTTDLAFFGTTNSSAYLTKVLDLAGFTEDEIAFMNAIRHHPQPNIVEIPRGEWKIIALGKVAGRLCEDRGITHTEVPHPAYWSRFHHADIEEYATLLRECR